MNFFRRSPAPPPPAPAPSDSWAATQVERTAADAGWATTHIEPAPAPKSWAAKRLESWVGAPAEPTAGTTGWAQTQIDTSDAPKGWAETQVDARKGGQGWPETQVGAGKDGQGWPEIQGGGRDEPQGWLETRALPSATTRFVGDADDYLAAPQHDIGRLTGADVRELFVSCGAAEALQQQFEHLQSEFIAIHDIATTSSRKLLDGVASATGRRVQKLVIRRQGFGTALASLEFVDVPTAQGKALRVYSTDAETDAAAQAALAKTLLGCSRLGVVMVGDLKPAAMATAFQPLADAMADGAWQNRQLLLLPLAAASALASHGISLGQSSGVSVRTTPQVLRPSDAWRFITASWSRLGEPVSAMPTPYTPATLRPMPTIGATAEPSTELIERYLKQLGDIAGLVSACVFELSSGHALAHAGGDVDGSQLALQGGQLLAAMGVASRSLGFGRMTPDAAITLGGHHLLLRGLPKHPALALHAVLDKNVANLTLARLQLQRMDALFDAPAT